MRRMLISLLLAGAASPALAAAPGRDDGWHRSDRAEARSERKAEREGERPQRKAEPRNVERSAPARSVERTVPAIEQKSLDRAMPARGPAAARGVEDGPRQSREGIARNLRGGPSLTGGSSGNIETATETVGRRSAGDSVREWRRGERVRSADGASIKQRNMRRAPGVGESGLVEQKRPLPRVLDRAERRVSRTPKFGTEPPAPRTATAIAAKPARHWRTDWRHDRRYDWRDWRRRHHSHFRLGLYYDPFGWNYFRYGIGWRLWPNYYRSSFWLRDPWQYRLPPAYGPYRWVRYYNDALLVNIYTGTVVDVVYNFFW